MAAASKVRNQKERKEQQTLNMNDHYLEIAIAAVGLVSGLGGVFFQTRNEGNQGLKLISTWGWAAAGLLILSSGAGLYTSFMAKAEANAKLDIEKEEKRKLQAKLDDADRLQREILSKTHKNVEEVIQRSGIPQDTFYIKVVTGKTSRDAGTDATVSIRLHGTNDTNTVSQWQRLSSSDNDFEEGATDHFLFSTIPLGTLESIELKLSRGKGNDVGWLFNKFEIEDRKRPGTVYQIDVPREGLWVRRDKGLKLPLKRLH